MVHIFFEIKGFFMQGSNKVEKFGGKKGRHGDYGNESEYSDGQKKKKRQDRCALRENKRGD